MTWKYTSIVAPQRCKSTPDLPYYLRQLGGRERMENLRGAFRVRQTPRVQDSHLPLVDDVLTAGSAIDQCARVLRQAGAASVRVGTVARG